MSPAGPDLRRTRRATRRLVRSRGRRGLTMFELAMTLVVISTMVLAFQGVPRGQAAAADRAAQGRIDAVASAIYNAWQPGIDLSELDIETLANHTNTPMTTSNIGWAAVTATGGTESIITVGERRYRLHVFDQVGEHTFTVTSTGTDGRVEYLIVGGGGGGGGFTGSTIGASGGGGGAGGLRTGVTNASMGPMAVTIGSGGSGGSALETPGGNGGSSVFEALRADGGGGGGGFSSAGGSGGSGGGGGGRTARLGGSGTAGQGNAGGASAPGDTTGVSAGGGGGGAGDSGVNATAVTQSSGEGAGGSGGSGLASSITGSTVTYAGGGGGAGNKVAGAGGSGGGGNGVTVLGVPGDSGTDGLGGGGGGARGGGASAVGGNGGSGIVIVRYPIDPPPAPDNTRGNPRDLVSVAFGQGDQAGYYGIAAFGREGSCWYLRGRIGSAAGATTGDGTTTLDLQTTWHSYSDFFTPDGQPDDATAAINCTGQTALQLQTGGISWQRFTITNSTTN
jgi:Tfp pilus assembly protein FimT